MPEDCGSSQPRQKSSQDPISTERTGCGSLHLSYQLRRKAQISLGRKTLYKKITKVKRAGGMAPSEEHLLSKYKALISEPSIKKKKFFLILF
jgi:hypothetical protein